jgi:hypothetical protein
MVAPEPDSSETSSEMGGKTAKPGFHNRANLFFCIACIFLATRFPYLTGARKRALIGKER